MVSWLIGLQFLQGTLFLAWCTFRLRPVEQGSRLPGLRRPRRKAPQGFRLFLRRACGDAPMIWKECTGALTSRGMLSTVCLVCLAVATIGGMGFLAYQLGIPAFQEVLDYGGWRFAAESARDNLNSGVRTLTACLYTLAAMLLGRLAAATGITMEREKDAWTSLTVTPLEGREIVAGKTLGAFWRVRGILAALLSVWFLGLICGGGAPTGVPAGDRRDRDRPVVHRSSGHLHFTAIAELCGPSR